MTTYVGARDALESHIRTAMSVAYPSVTLIWENTVQVDLTKITSPFVRIEIDMQDAVGLTINDIPEDKVVGEVSFGLMFKEGEGTRAALAIFDFLRPLMKSKTLSGVTTGIPRPGRKQALDGWVFIEMVVDFQFDSL